MQVQPIPSTRGRRATAKREELALDGGGRLQILDGSEQLSAHVEALLLHRIGLLDPGKDLLCGLGLAVNKIAECAKVLLHGSIIAHLGLERDHREGRVEVEWGRGGTERSGCSGGRRKQRLPPR